ncbi:MAG: NAD-dependent epimerase/dehydratase family protein [bacterium]
MKYFITGGTGFIGRHVVTKLCEDESADILCITRKTQKEALHNVTYREGDICDPDVVAECGEGSDYIIHMAGCKNDPHSFFKANVEGTQNILNASSRSAHLKKLIYMSSVGVIGDTKELLINEQTECQPNNDYERSKYQAELMVRKYSREHPGKVVIVRPTNVFGEDDPETHLLNLSRKIKHHCFFFVGRDISTYYVNYVYVREISELIPQLLTSSHSHDLYIINTPTLLSKFIMTIQKIFHSDTPIKHLPYLPIKIIASCFDAIPRSIMRHPPVNSLKLKEVTNKKQYSAALLKQDLGWSPAFTMENALTNLLSDYTRRGLLA